MNEIQKARDVLAKWRADDDDPMPYWTEDQHFGFGDSSARLIVGTAGNPDLLDAIDGLLRDSQTYFGDGGWPGSNANNVADAIVAADERMQQ